MITQQHIGCIFRTYSGVYKIRAIGEGYRHEVQGDLLGRDGKPTGHLEWFDQSDCDLTAYDLNHFAQTGDLKPIE